MCDENSSHLQLFQAIQPCPFSFSVNTFQITDTRSVPTDTHEVTSWLTGAPNRGASVNAGNLSGLPGLICARW